MRPVRQVRKRDGRVVDFDEQKIADAIYKAALSVGAEDRFLAEEMASVVTLFLDKLFPDSIPGIEDVQDMVERVLIETGHARTAKAYILYREKRAKLREAEARAREPVQQELFAPGPVTCLDAAAERIRRLDRDGLRRQLAAETDLSEEAAGPVADAVLDRLKALRVTEVRGGLLARIIDGELAAHGHLEAIASRGEKGLDRERLTAALFPKEGERARTPSERAGRAILRLHSLEDVLPPRVAAAHIEGRIHLRGLSTPSAVFAASLSPDAIRLAGPPGVAGRSRPAGTPRRFAAHLGRVVRRVAEHVSHGVSLHAMNFLSAPLLADVDRDGLREEAWHLLAELSDLPDVEIGLALSPPAILAARSARGADGEPIGKNYAAFAPVALEYAEAILDVLGTGEGLGSRSALPRTVLALGPGSLADDAPLRVLVRALAAGPSSEPVLVLLDREDLPLIGTSRVRARVEDATRLTDTTTLSLVVAARAVVNLPRAALRAGLGNTGGFIAEVADAADLALEGLAARERFLRRSAGSPDGALHPFAGRGDGAALLDLDHAVHSLAALGLNEAVFLATGEELHDSDEALKLGLRALGALDAKCRERKAHGLEVAVDAEEDATVAARFPPLDAADFPAAAPRLPAAYTAGVGLRADAPLDVALRLDLEGRIAMVARFTTVALRFPDDRRPSPETLVALLRKTWKNTRIRQIVVGRPL